MRLSQCVGCGQQIKDGEKVFAYAYGYIKINDPVVGFSMESLDALEHDICPHPGD